jgi:SET domain-containing protein
MSRVPPKDCWIHPATEVRDSSIAGRGLFATTEIHEGERVSQLGGLVVTEEELVALLEERGRNASLPYVDSIIFDERLHLFLPPDQPNHFGNHSCDPNLWWGHDLTLVARREIHSGEELTNDYGTSSGDPTFEMECNCGSSLCRHLVTGEDWRRPDLRKRYGPHWVPALRKRIEAAEL